MLRISRNDNNVVKTSSQAFLQVFEFVINCIGMGYLTGDLMFIVFDRRINFPLPPNTGFSRVT